MNNDISLSDSGGDDDSFDSNSVWSGYSEDTSEDGFANINMDSRFEDGCAGSAYWSAQNESITIGMYPRLFIVKLRGEDASKPQPGSTNLLLRLPAEIRNRIYQHYFDDDGNIGRLADPYISFQDREGTELNRLKLTHDNYDLKNWLSSPLLRTSRVLRHEAMCLLFSKSVIDVQWLSHLLQFVDFLGPQGCKMIRSLDVYDNFNMRREDTTSYQNILTSIQHFPTLKHLRINLSPTYLWADERTRSWFDSDAWHSNTRLKPSARPQIRSECIDTVWPEHRLLRTLSAHQFTLTTRLEVGESLYRKFSRVHGVMPGICESMLSHYNEAQIESALPAAEHVQDSMTIGDSQPLIHVAQSGGDRSLPDVNTTKVSVNTSEHAGTLTDKRWAGTSGEIPHPQAMNMSGSEVDPESYTSQDSDTLANKSVPLYNFIREILGDITSPLHVNGLEIFPVALASTGRMMLDCPLCYICQQHCGYHNMPTQSPSPTSTQGLGLTDELVNPAQTQFDHLSYANMRQVCRGVVHMLTREQLSIKLSRVPVWSFEQIATVLEYIGWPHTTSSVSLEHLDMAVIMANWTGQAINKEEVTPWDVLYREIRAAFCSSLESQE